MAGVTTKNKPTKIEELTKEEIRRAILKKRECNAKAQLIVENLLEKCISEEYFLKCLPDINQSHFEDVIEERSIIHICGYPLCQKTLSEKDIPKQKYRISIKTNKVYDITARKSFCSNTCYKSAMYIKKQMMTSPLWFREYEDIPTFHLLTQDAVGSLGQEVDLGIIEKIDRSELKSFTSINDFTNASLTDIQGKEGSENNTSSEKRNEEINIIDTLKKMSLDSSESHSTDQKQDTLIQNSVPEKDSNKSSDVIAQNSVNVPKSPTDIKKPQKKLEPNPLNIVGDIIEKPSRKIDPILINTQKAPAKGKENSQITRKVFSKKQPSVTTIIIEVEKCLAEWFTLDTLLFLLGKDRVKELVEDKGKSIKEYLNNHAQSIFYKSNSYDQYQTLCRKLNMLELEDRRYDAQTLAKEMKPLPDYRMLKEESKKLQLKVKAFLSGETEVPHNTSPETPTPTDDENITHLPLVDKNAQNALRRRIVCQHLNKVLPDLLRSLGLLTLSISDDVRLLVNSFQLRPNNIMFKPLQWTLIAIVFIKLLALRDGRLEYLLKQPMAFQHMQLLLLSYRQDGGYLDRLMEWLIDVDRLIDVNDKQLTIE